MRYAVIEIQMHTSDHDADVMAHIPEMIRQRFAGTAIYVDKIQATAAWTDYKKEEQ